MTDPKTISFSSTSYTRDGLAAMTITELLELRNLVASSLGAPSIREFKNQEVAVDQTWKALERFDTQMTAEQNEIAGDANTTTNGDGKPAKAKAPKAPKEPKDRKPAKSSGPGLVKRPTRKMFSTITKTGEHNGADHGRAHRWPNYKDGMTLVDVIEGDGTEPWDVYNWQSKGIMSVTEPTDAEHEERLAAFYKRHGLTDPNESKAIKAKERAEAKAKREAEQAEKKALREAAAAEKKAAADAAKAAKAAEPAKA